MKTKPTIKQQAKAAADYMKNGIHRDNTWVRVYKGSRVTQNKKEINRLVDALSIHFDGVGFGLENTDTHYEIACSDAGVADGAREYIAGWLAK